MVQHLRGSRATAIAAAISLVVLSGPTSLVAASPASLAGSVVVDDDGTPLPGARLWAGDTRTGNVYSSTRATATGTIALADLPASTYQIGVEHEGGLWLVDETLTLAPGQAQSLRLALAGDPLGQGVDDEAEDDEEVDLEDDDVVRPDVVERHKPSLWSNPLTAALIVLGAAVVVGVLVEGAVEDDEDLGEEPASRFASPGF